MVFGTIVLFNRYVILFLPLLQHNFGFILAFFNYRVALLIVFNIKLILPNCMVCVFGMRVSFVYG